jgi:AhpD family alkylhydroperoxidase
MNSKTIRAAALAVATGLVLAGPLPARADDAMRSAEASAQATYDEVQSTLGGVPTFVKLFPKGAIAGAWAEQRDLELSDKTALSPKVKALISLAVAAQIPCQYCIWADTKTAKAMGASQEEIAEAVAMAGLTRHWSTFFNGMQLDLTQYKAELGGA